MAGEARIITERRGEVLVATFHNPPDGLMDLHLLEQLEALLHELEADRDLRAVVFTGGVAGAFIRHFDVRVIAELTGGDAAAVIGRMHAAYDRVEALGVPTIAAIDGACMGGGLEFALCCDLRIAAPSAGPFGFPECSVGIFPATGGTQRAPRIIGEARALELMLTGRLLRAQEAFELGLLHRLADAPLEAAARLASRLAGMPAASLKTIKGLVRGACERPLRDGLQQERVAFAEILQDPECSKILKRFAGGSDPVAR
jgi:enoyl-CoA hydratase/carnithine racemase